MESKILCYVDQSDSFRTSCKMLSDKNRRSSFSYDLTNERLDWIFFFFFSLFLERWEDEDEIVISMQYVLSECLQSFRI